MITPECNEDFFFFDVILYQTKHGNETHFTQNLEMNVFNNQPV